MSLVGHKARNGKRRMNKHDDLISDVNLPVRSATIGETRDMRVFNGYNYQLSRGRVTVLEVMKKKIKKPGSNGAVTVRKIRDRGAEDDDEHPTTFGGLIAKLPKTTSNTVKDSMMPSRIRLTKVPNAPMPGQAPTIWSAKKEAEVELLMLRGVTDSKEMSILIKLSEYKSREFMERVKARWAITGSCYDIKRGRGEALAYLGTMKRALWEIVESKSAVVDGKTVKGAHEGGHVYKSESRVYSLSLLTRLFGSQLMLEGVTQDAVEDLSRAADESGEVMQRMSKQRALTSIAGRLLDIVGTMREAKKASGPIVDVE